MLQSKAKSLQIHDETLRREKQDVKFQKDQMANLQNQLIMRTGSGLSKAGYQSHVPQSSNDQLGVSQLQDNTTAEYIAPTVNQTIMEDNSMYMSVEATNITQNHNHQSRPPKLPPRPGTSNLCHQQTNMTAYYKKCNNRCNSRSDHEHNQNGGPLLSSRSGTGSVRTNSALKS